LLSSPATILKAYAKVKKTLENYEASLVAVSKRQPLERIQVLVDAGHRDFGENYLQEWEQKKELLPSDLNWHFVGQLQSRKIKSLVQGGVHCVHSVGSSSSIKKIKGFDPPPSWLIQINLAGEEQKGGLSQDEFHLMMEKPEDLTGLKGLMCIPPSNLSQSQLQAHFKKMRELKDQYSLKELSMGMSADWEMALDEGSTLIRLGSVLFGERNLI
jgi:PLP dependent protein